MIPAIIGAATAIGGKLFDMHQARKAAKHNPLMKRMNDAREAGVHPMYALGANVQDSPPAQVAFGETLGKMGQSIGGALSKGLDTDGKAMKNLLLEKAGLENELLRTQITRAQVDQRATPTLPPLDPKYLMEGQGQTSIPKIPGTLIEVPGAHKVEQPQYLPNLTLGWPYRSNPKFSDMQSIEDRYGEGTLISHILSNVIFGADMYHQLPNWVKQGEREDQNTKVGITKGIGHLRRYYKGE